MKLIDKSALVAEIERRISVLKANESVISMLAGGMFINEFKDLLSFLDTLEVKEVDLEKEYEEFVVNDPVYNKLVNGIVGKAIAKHFFELGLKAKGE
jgi:hypothetical protein